MFKIKNRALALALPVVFILSLAACAGKDEATTVTSAQNTSLPTISPAESSQNGSVIEDSAPLESVLGVFIFEEGQFVLPINDVESGSIAIPDKTTLEKIGVDFNYPMTGKYHLTSDIDLSGENWTPIGSQQKPFQGTFDGQGYKIKGLTITGEVSNEGGGINVNYAGLFGHISNSEIRNVGLEGTNIDVTLRKGMVGAIAGGGLQGDDFVITNCFNIGTVSATLPFYGGSVGGICGGGSGNVSIDACNNSGTVSISNDSDAGFAGGIFGSGFRVHISNCNNSGVVTSFARSSHIGGIVGDANSVGITNCFNSGNIEGRTVYGANVGGICGNGGATISGCTNTGNVYCQGAGDVYAGGIDGFNAESIDNCFNLGNITAIADDYSSFKHKAVASGIGSNSKIVNCYNTGSLSALSSDDNKAFLGAICAGESNRGTPVNSYWNSDSDQTMNNTPLTTGKRGVGNAEDTTTPLASAEMSKMESFWGFVLNEILGFKDCANIGCPNLKCF
jgi:hypothetical protein